MLRERDIWSRAMRLHFLHTVLITILSAIIAWTIWQPVPVAFTTLEWALYDNWHRVRTPPSPSSSILVVIRDPETDNRFGDGIWDRALIAKVVSAAHQAGAAVIGLDL
ncbi:MAG: CHASE2 domain-containing protein, partial [Nitrospiraceae bacterium]